MSGHAFTSGELRAKLDAAIRSEAWGAVEAIRERLREAERFEAQATTPANVVPIRRCDR